MLFLAIYWVRFLGLILFYIVILLRIIHGLRWNYMDYESSAILLQEWINILLNQLLACYMHSWQLPIHKKSNVPIEITTNRLQALSM